MGKLVVIRHAQASIHKANYDQLSDLGKRQADLLGAYLVKQKIALDVVYRGTLQRHRETEEIVGMHFQQAGLDWKIRIAEGINEHRGPRAVRWLLSRIDAGEEATELDDLQKILEPYTNASTLERYLAIYDFATVEWAKGRYDTAHLGITDWAAFRTLTEDSLEEILATNEQDKMIGIITSGGPMGVSMGKALQLSHAQVMRLNSIIYNTAISIFDVEDGILHLRSFNAIPHLLEAEYQTLV